MTSLGLISSILGKSLGVTMKNLIWILLFSFSLPSSVFAEIYQWVDDKGKVHFSDKKPAATQAEKLDLEINTYTNVTIENSPDDVGQKVVMYSTDWCGYCKKARKYFERNNISFVDYDIEKNAKAKKRYDKMGATGVPVILVGKKRMSGFSEQRFEQLYN